MHRRISLHQSHPCRILFFLSRLQLKISCCILIPPPFFQGFYRFFPVSAICQALPSSLFLPYPRSSLPERNGRQQKRPKAQGRRLFSCFFSGEGYVLLNQKQ